MRDCTRKIVRAWSSRQPAKTKNTRTDGFSIWLHNNEIVSRQNHAIMFTVHGWPTPTTLDRINAVLDTLHTNFRLCRHKGDIHAFPVASLHHALVYKAKPKYWPRLDIYAWHDVKDIEMQINNICHIFKEEAA